MYRTVHLTKKISLSRMSEDHRGQVMEEVWVLMQDTYEGAEVHGVFRSRNGAKAAADKFLTGDIVSSAWNDRLRYSKRGGKHWYQLVARFTVDALPTTEDANR